MRKLYCLFPLICVAMMLSLACDDDAPTTYSTGVQNQFPNTIGFQWTYEVSEPGSPVDTVTVRVMSAGTSPEGEPARVWYASYRNRIDTGGVAIIDTMWVVESQDNVKVFRSRPPRVMSFVMPYEVSNSWTTPGYYDTTTVTNAVSLISYPGGVLTGGYLLTREWSEQGVGNENSSLIVVPDVGIVSMSLNAVSVVTPRGTTLDNWRLLSFDLD